MEEEKPNIDLKEQHKRVEEAKIHKLRQRKQILMYLTLILIGALCVTMGALFYKQAQTIKMYDVSLNCANYGYKTDAFYCCIGCATAYDYKKGEDITFSYLEHSDTCLCGKDNAALWRNGAT